MPLHPRVPLKPGTGAYEVGTMRRAVALIVEMGAELDRRLACERRPDERMRMLRESTSRITRAANDAIHAYRTGMRALDRVHNGYHEAEVAKVRGDLGSARRDLLTALAAASERYPWAPALTTKPDA